MENVGDNYLPPSLLILICSYVSAAFTPKHFTGGRRYDINRVAFKAFEEISEQVRLPNVMPDGGQGPANRQLAWFFGRPRVAAECSRRVTMIDASAQRRYIESGTLLWIISSVWSGERSCDRRLL